jgi:hypothetical protein
MAKKKRKYTVEQYAQGAAVCFFGVLVGCLIPWYTETSPVHTRNFNGFDDPFIGLWAVILSGVGMVAAAPVGFKMAKDGGAKALLGASALLYTVALVLTLIDMFRDVPTYVYMGGSGSRMFGVYAAAACAGLGVASAGAGLALAVKEAEDAEEQSEKPDE